MTREEARKTLTAKVECMKRESSGIDQDCNYRNCDECKLCYEQGTVGEQIEALQVAISALGAINQYRWERDIAIQQLQNLVRSRGKLTMREILFRAKCFDNGEWVYGVPIKKALAGSHDGYYPKIIPECDGRHQTIYSTAIKEETLGQYTGLTDKNGKKIFENDIVKTKYGRLCEVIWFSSPCSQCWDLIPVEDKHKAPDSYDVWASKNLEVIGNIYDNPELIGGESNG